MKLVIDIDEKCYNIIMDWKKTTQLGEVFNAVANGTPLPKGHGDLIDADELRKKLHRYTEAPYQYALKEQKPCEDCVSRQAILGIIHFEDNWLYDTQSYNANTVIAFSGLKSKVKALPSVNPQEQESVIDKIRAEIEQERIGYPPSADYYKAIMKCLQIIDKYKDSEDKE